MTDTGSEPSREVKPKPPLLQGETTQLILKGFYHVYNTLAYGFLEVVYEKALIIALRKLGLRVERQVPITVFFEGEPAGEYFADLLVNGVVIVEIKAAERLSAAHEAQLLDYLKATGVKVGLVLNFGPKPHFCRMIA